MTSTKIVGVNGVSHISTSTVMDPDQTVVDLNKLKANLGFEKSMPSTSASAAVVGPEFEMNPQTIATDDSNKPKEKPKRRIISRAPISLTENAAKRIKEIMDEKTEPCAGLRLSVITKGCNGLSYTLDYVKEKGKFDEDVIQYGVHVFVDPKAMMHVVGTTMDYVEEDFRSEFVFNNPNVKSKCGCGSSFLT